MPLNFRGTFLSERCLNVLPCAFHVFVIGVVRNFKFNVTLMVTSPSLLTTSHPWKGRGQGHVTHFYILGTRPFGADEARHFKFGLRGKRKRHYTY